jgi:hypothetical protein
MAELLKDAVDIWRDYMDFSSLAKNGAAERVHRPINVTQARLAN